MYCLNLLLLYFALYCIFFFVFSLYLLSSSTVLVKGGTGYDILSCFFVLGRCKLSIIGRKPLNNSFSRGDKHQRGKNKPKMNKDVLGWRRLTRIANDELEKCRLNFSRCTNRDVAPSILCHLVSTKIA